MGDEAPWEAAVKVLLPTMRDPGQIGGTSTHLAMLVRGLRELGHEAEALYLGSAVPMPLRKAGLIWPAGALNRLRSGWGMMYAAEARARLLAAVTRRRLESAATAWEVLNAQEVYSVPYLRVLADRFGIPLVLTLHGYPLYESVSEGYTAKSRLGRHYLMRAEIRALRLADAVVTVDSRLYRHALGLVPERADSLYTLKNFIDTSVFAPPADPGEDERLRREERAAWGIPQDKIVLFCPRRLVKKNGVIYPSLALATMSPADRERFLLLHAGEGGERQEIERIVRENRLEGQVRLLGGQGPEAIRRLYRLADIVLVPSVHSENVEEATSLAALEAMASGRPLIAGAVGGLAEMVVDGENGLLVPVDPQALAAAILRLAAAPHLGERLAAAARRYVVENHSHLGAAAAYLEVYRRAREGLSGRPEEAGAGRSAEAVGGSGFVASAAPVPGPVVTDPLARAQPLAQPARGSSARWVSVSVLGFPLDLVSLEEAAQWVMEQARGAAEPRRAAGASSSPVAGPSPGASFSPGPDFVTGPAPGCTAIALSFNPELVIRAQRDPAVAEVLYAADLCYPDGVGAVWAAARQGARRVGHRGGVHRWVPPERVPGIELAERVLELAAAEGRSVFFLGAEPGVAEQAARRQKERLPGLHIAGTHHGYFAPEDESKVVDAIRASGAHILLVAMGAPRQELFLYRHRERLGVRVGLGVGGSFDVWAGRVKRAPNWVQRAKVEWLYRLLSDPRRLRRQWALPWYAWQVWWWCPEDYGPPRRRKDHTTSADQGGSP